ncbi:inorganic diphosphatase [Candidatus Saccharibacteria bacterium]|jgi:inorganic pyrophosphatase|nr:inorganic diphosphatase [Candidatus Saccharibacteria bacterium]MBP9131839.1 inorganic diphosphatase [Candidatus Saccharibacteria bacterium]
MPDFNVILDAGDVDGGIINTVIEIPRGSMMKIEWNRKLATFELDRVEPGIFAKPTNYGFIPQTLDEDGDELDTLVITEEGIPTGVFLKARVIGILNFDDDNEMDHKVVCVAEDDRHFGKITSLDELSDSLKNQIEHHFNHYKDLKKPGTTKVLGWGDIDAAKAIIRESQERYKQEA